MYEEEDEEAYQERKRQKKVLTCWLLHVHTCPPV